MDAKRAGFRDGYPTARLGHNFREGVRGYTDIVPECRGLIVRAAGIVMKQSVGRGAASGVADDDPRDLRVHNSGVRCRRCGIAGPGLSE